MPSSVIASLASFGGVVSFLVGGYATGVGSQFSVGRSSTGSGGPFLNIYSGAVVPFYIDLGDGLPTPLLSGSTYYWTFSDPSGSVLVGPLTPTGSIQFTPDNLTSILIRCLQAGIDNIGPLPNGIIRATVMQDMPLNGFPSLPLISVTAQMEDQEDIGIGQQIVNPNLFENQSWSQAVQARKMWRVSILAKDSLNRDFYKDLILNIFHAMLPTIFLPMGQNTSHRYMVSVGQTSEDLKNKSPGFYFADCLLEITGQSNVNIQLNYPPVSGILVGITASQPASAQVNITVSALAH